jgi:type II secretory pathway component PulL
MGLGLLFLGALILFNLHQKTTDLDRQYQGIKKEMIEILRDTFPEAQIIPGREAALMDQKVTEQRSQFGWLESLTAGRNVLDILMVLTNALSTYKDVTIDNISVDNREIHLDGRASSFQTVDRVKESLEKVTAFGNVKLLSAKSDKGEGSVRFSFVLEEAP